MKKTMLCLSLFVLVSTCFVTNAMAIPKITGVRGGYGVTATVLDADGLNWQINIKGTQIFQGTKTVGAISGDYTMIRTPIFPPALGIGKINIKVAIYWIIIPVAIEERNAFMLGPFILLIQ
jgi:hypothetical protein